MSAVLVTVPEAEPVVAAHRATLDRAASWGVPAHVTVLFPFVAPTAIDAGVRTRLASAAASVPPFSSTFDRVDWFGTDVLWLAPRPAWRFSDLIRAVGAAFPDHPPYGGLEEEVVPHLTVGQGAAVGDLRRAEAEVRPQLPVTTDVTELELWCGADAPASWRRTDSFRLG